MDNLLAEWPFQEMMNDTEVLEGCTFPVPKLKIGHIRADHDGWRWHNNVWPCHCDLATPEACKEIDGVYDELTAADALKDLSALRSYCGAHMEACIGREFCDEFSFFYVGEYCDYWIRLITRKGDYNLYLNAYAKDAGYKKYYDYLVKLRDSGETNMYGAVSYLQSEFLELRYDYEKAKEILLEWIKSFEKKGGGCK